MLLQSVGAYGPFQNCSLHLAADMMAGSLMDVLHMRSATHTFVAFVDIFEAFDTSCVFSMGVHGRMWALIAHFAGQKWFRFVRTLAGLRYCPGQSALSVALQHSR